MRNDVDKIILYTGIEQGIEAYYDIIQKSISNLSNKRDLTKEDILMIIKTSKESYVDCFKNEIKKLQNNHE